MKILYITNHVSWGGGLERILAIKTRYFIERYDYEIHIATFNAPTCDHFFSFHSKIRFHNATLSGSALNQLYQRIAFINNLTNTNLYIIFILKGTIIMKINAYPIVRKNSYITVKCADNINRIVEYKGTA